LRGAKSRLSDQGRWSHLIDLSSSEAGARSLLLPVTSRWTPTFVSRPLRPSRCYCVGEEASLDASSTAGGTGSTVDGEGGTNDTLVLDTTTLVLCRSGMLLWRDGRCRAEEIDERVAHF